ncbi:carbamoyl-phosphate synthase subunit L [Nocardioides sp. Root122]|uniref:acetyl/propionyl/methylcrotonyl-CoA carboxylase subunit alpha n=1 Tax=Nocardioides TaxID=1839 RepID=UPI000702668C|nr:MULTISPECIES: biotin carboxylase N-terminal domain-containing protein [Nocardioides]KQV64275.1 carbamoyl-phosphate synthase subunit L [Nocardioides sp. Root122]MCK9824827.1 ATP-grasp domain-containing protein [Nocardioides cavernae]
MRTLLIANRGEIAIRVMRTAKRLGWQTVAIHTDQDADAPHVRAAGRAAAVSSYLDIDAVVAAARETGATHVHPGYGFLSERAPFARALAEAGITLVGPSAEVMDAMGRKDAAREIAVTAGVPVVPSYALDADPASFAYPVLVKAAAGGGGKGMRVVRTAAELPEAMAAAAREAASSFGDDTLLIEKYVESGRHIEVQVLGDTHGHVLHFFERDCSTQRRHQKVLEEAPAPTISEAQRESITSAAVALAQQVSYTNAGTVEFLLDNATGEFYFLEMNTRLQVEHPVTEEVTRVQTDRGRERVDLVELQLRVATGEPLDIDQADVTLEGHAIEARVYAEDSFNGFLPQAGRTSIVRWASSVRVDHALEPKQEVSTSYDPMLGKVIAWGPDRESARAALVAALDETAVLGITTNTGFLRALAASDEFRDATIDTAWLDRHEVPAPDAGLARVFGAWTEVLLDTASDRAGTGPWQADGWRMGADPAPATVALGDDLMVVDRARGRVTGGGRSHDVRMVDAADHAVHLLVDGVAEHAVLDVQRDAVDVVHRGQRWVWERPDPFSDHAASAGDGTLVAPMPGTVLAVNVAEGQVVAEGETLGVMEAMKMELALKAPFAGAVTTVGASPGDLVKLGAVLFVVEADA